MTMLPFNRLFPDRSKSDARALRVRWAHGGLPVDDFVLVEHYCALPGCDCRRVLLGVVRASTRAHVATINYVFGTAGDPGGPAGAGASLDTKNTQSELSNELLALFVESCVGDPRYVDQIEEHYRLWRQIIEDPTRRKRT